MKRLYSCSLGVMLMAVVLGGCASARKHPSVTIEPVMTLSADTASMVDLDLNICVPKGTLSKRNRLIVVPQLMRHDSVLAEFRPVALDAPVYVRKLRRKQVLDAFVDSLSDYAVKVNRGEDLVIHYKERVEIPKHVSNAKIVAVITSDGCAECGVVDSVDMAYLSSATDLMERPEKALRLCWIEPEFVIRPKVMADSGEAHLQFAINRFDIDLSEEHNRKELNAMLSTLSKIVRDSLATLNGVKIYGMSSADGSFAHNNRLAADRAAAAKKWLVDQLVLNRSVADRFEVGSRPEGWQPVLDAMRAAGSADTLDVQNILRKYSAENDDKAEYYIRRLPCWNEIKSHYLQKARKVIYEYTYTLKSFTTDEELLRMYDKRPDAFNEDELLRVSTLKKTTEAKVEVYRTLLHYFPQSQTAANNLAVLLLKEGKSAEADSLLSSLKDYTPEVLNTLAAVYVYRHDYEKAVELLETHIDLPEARYNLGLLKAEMRQLDDAYRLLRNYNDVNAAVVSLSVNEVEQALRQMSNCKESGSRAEYVRAVIYARMKEKQLMLDHLRQAIMDVTLRERAVEDVDFKDYWEDSAFVDMVKGGRH